MTASAKQGGGLRREAAAPGRAAGEVGRETGGLPTVSVIVPVLNEEGHIERCLASIEAQTYPAIIEILVADGGSTDRTLTMATAHPLVRVLRNPSRIQAAGLNAGLAIAAGDVVVRVDGHCVLASDYVSRCVDALQATGAAMVGGSMVPQAGGGWIARSVAQAMASPLGAGPARFHVGGPPGWVDTVYLGSYRREVARRAGGYRVDVGVNEDAELAYRLRGVGGVWFDPAIRASYTPRQSLTGVARQFFRYGLSRSATVRRHPGSVSARQLAPPLLVLGLISPCRRWVAGAYVIVIGACALREVIGKRTASAAGMFLVLPAMHGPWGAGFLLGISGVVKPPAPLRASPARRVDLTRRRSLELGGRSGLAITPREADRPVKG